MRMVVLSVALILTGCGSGTLPPQADTGLARSSLETALVAWSRSETAESLTHRDPPIYLNDSRYKAGARLEKYAIQEDSERTGQSVRITATLTLVLKNGKKLEKRTNFTVDTAPVVVIVGE